MRGPIELIRPALFEGTGVGAAYTTRRGGVSRGPYSSLNLGLHVGDEAPSVLENRRLVCGELGIDPRRLTGAVQSHGGGVAVVAGGDAGRGSTRWEDGFGGTDALVTGLARVPLTAVAADCLLVALADPEAGAVGAVHAGRRAALAGVVRRAVEAMASSLGAEPGRMLAVLGPHIRECCYEVGPEVRAEAAAALGGPADWLFAGRAGGRPRFRLAELARRELVSCGLAVGNIEEIPLCTACEAERFFSHRRDGAPTGRNALVIWNEPEGGAAK